MYIYVIFLMIIMVLLNMKNIALFSIGMYIAISLLIQIKNRTKQGEEYKQSNNPLNIWKRYEELCKNKRIVNDNVFLIYKGPESLKYLKRIEPIKTTCEDLYILINYEMDAFVDVLIYLDYFFKIHYKLMLGKYDACTYIPILMDIQKNIVNNLATFVFCIPMISNIINKGDIDLFMRQKITQIQSFTERYLNIAKKKYDCNGIDKFKEFDDTMNKHEFV